MRRFLSLLCLSAGLAVGAGCCHTCDVCDDCGGCYDSNYNVYSSPGCSTCGGGMASTTKQATQQSTKLAGPIHSTVKTR